MTDYYLPINKEFIQSRIDQWKSTQAVARDDLEHSTERINYWLDRLASFD